MRERGAVYEDVRRALLKAVSCKADEGQRWLVEGPDLSDEPLCVVVAIEDGLVVVTVFG